MERIEALDRMCETNKPVDGVTFDTMLAYRRAIVNDLEMPDFNEWLPNVRMWEYILKNFKDFGIKGFTISSATSNMTDYAWFLLEHGCTLEGMTMIHEKATTSWEREQSDKPAFIFSIVE